MQMAEKGYASEMVLEWRFGRAPGLQRKASRLSPDELVALRERVRSFARPANVDQSLDISGLDANQVRDFLTRLPIAPDSPVLIGWWDDPSAGLATDFATFTEQFDNIWYPSSDNLFVVPTTLDWLIDLDHEEQMSFRLLK